MTRFNSLPLACFGFVAAVVSSVAAQSLKSVLAEQNNLTMFRELVDDYEDIYSKLSDDVTIIAPNDGAFNKRESWDDVPEDIPVWLRYGILEGKQNFGSLEPGDIRTLSTLLDDSQFSNVTGGQKVIVTKQPGNEVVLTSGTGTHITVVKEDIPFDGGLIQIVESHYVTPLRLEPSIRDSYRDLTSFLGALYAADLVEEFAETPNATIFAPHNSAFQRLAGLFEDMSRDDLRRILRYHLVPKQVLRASDLGNSTNLDTEAEDGESVHVTRYNNDIFVNSAKIIQTDLLVANGIVQMIDNVLNVDESNARPVVTQSQQDAVFSATGTPSVGTGAPVPFISDLPCTENCATSSNGAGPTGQGASGTSSDNAARPAFTGIGGSLGMGLGMAAAGLGLWGAA